MDQTKDFMYPRQAQNQVGYIPTPYLNLCAFNHTTREPIQIHVFLVMLCPGLCSFQNSSFSSARFLGCISNHSLRPQSWHSITQVAMTLITDSTRSFPLGKDCKGRFRDKKSLCGWREVRPAVKCYAVEIEWVPGIRLESNEILYYQDYQEEQSQENE